jgi:Arc/MetJ-type ribon-helix-helix transcriptional regulator
MTAKVQELRPKLSDSEKITINLGYVDLGQIDLLVQEGFYSNRTDLIRTAIRNQLDRHTDVVKQSVARHQLDLGLRHYSRQDLEAVKAAGETLHIQVLGLAVIASDVPPKLALETIASIHVLGRLPGIACGEGGAGRPHPLTSPLCSQSEARSRITPFRRKGNCSRLASSKRQTRILSMNALPTIDMMEAPRLTRDGRLEEAMAVLRGALPEALFILASRDVEADTRQADPARTALPRHGTSLTPEQEAVGHRRRL